MGKIGSIPAQAGKPLRAVVTWPKLRVHPRAGGEAGGCSPYRPPMPGPSPRRRGSRAPRAAAPARQGSIPAQAGKPRHRCAAGQVWGVHPRAGGEAFIETEQPGHPAGPSPRRRGSRALPSARVGSYGSIPAQAGKPCCGPAQPSGAWVHPRAGGEAFEYQNIVNLVQGPSPRRRGSRFRDRAPCCDAGSIPAQAGKPIYNLATDRLLKVHPRAGGEADRSLARAIVWSGPSPRRRGSPHVVHVRRRGRGSIPAQAGKPPHRARRPRAGVVHPRAGGEAAQVDRRRSSGGGPSPRRRGSRDEAAPAGSGSGSIPAQAGKPPGRIVGRIPGRLPQPLVSGVHPRAGGEA